jgi:hypothetical protein
VAFEIVDSPHLPPHRCAACGCTEGGPYVFLPQSVAWEYGWPFICLKCVGEMSHAMGITLEIREVEKIVEVEVVRPPTDGEMLAYVLKARNDMFFPPPVDTLFPLPVGAIAEHGKPASTQAKLTVIKEALNAGVISGQEVMDAFAEVPVIHRTTCSCGAEFTGPTAKAKLGSHQRSCKVAKEGAQLG